MNITTDTLSVLKNFSDINQNILNLIQMIFFEFEFYKMLSKYMSKNNIAFVFYL